MPGVPSGIKLAGLLVVVALTLCIVVRFCRILPGSHRLLGPKDRRACHMCIILGSGGHTAEMLAMLTGLDTRIYTRRTYLVQQGDTISTDKAYCFEQALQAVAEAQGGLLPRQDTKQDNYGSYSLVTVPRARKVHQSFLTAPFTCFITLLAALRALLVRPAPDIILLNGPATSAIVVYASLLLRFLDWNQRQHFKTRIIYVESFARIKSLSLTANVIAWAVDRLLVQWSALHGMAGGKAEYSGLLVLPKLKRIQHAWECESDN